MFRKVVDGSVLTSDDHYTFLLDKHGEFRADHMDVINPGDSG